MSRSSPPDTSYLTAGGITIARRSTACPYEAGMTALAARLDRARGVLLSSSFEFPGRYTRFDIGFADPPLMVTARGRQLQLAALNARGGVLLAAILPVLRAHAAVATIAHRPGEMRAQIDIAPPGPGFAEEDRSRQPSVFSALRAISALFAAADPHLGLYGAFGYDLVFQFEPMALRLPRSADQRDLVLFLPDDILVVDHMRGIARRHRYDFTTQGGGTAGLPRRTPPQPFTPSAAPAAPPASDHEPGAYAAMVERARAACAAGDLFEVVLGQNFTATTKLAPSALFARLRRINPAPYGALMNLGEGEFLVAASPEMFVRVEGRRIETCPISGTIKRGADALEDAANIRTLLNSAKEESELTMCTDVDRNDKARVCVPGSVRIIGRRQIETYARVIHTVDHVEGVLAPGFDAYDGFLSHAWAVTVTGAPKPWAIRHIEAEERSARRWYGGAIGRIGFDGSMNTGLTLRTLRLHRGVAEIRAGATLLHDSDPAAEEAECRLKAAALFAALADAPPTLPPSPRTAAPAPRVLLVDHEDSFVQNLAAYFRAAGALVSTLRHAQARAALAQGEAADLLVLSPGPGRPQDFALSDTIALALGRQMPVFGVCLGLQGIVMHFGGRLALLHPPMHGRASPVAWQGGRLLGRLEPRFTVGRYHSWHADRQSLPDALAVTAETPDGIIMGIEHVHLPIAAVQFHPESLLTSPAAIGPALVGAALHGLTAPGARCSLAGTAQP